MERRQYRQAHPGRAAVALGLMLVLGAGAGGCSDLGLPAEDVRSGAGDPLTLLTGAAGALIDAGSSKAGTAMEMATGGTRVTIRGKGIYDYVHRLGRLTVVLPADPAGAAEHRPLTELLAPGALFMKNRGAGVPADKWVRVETATLSDGNLVTGGVTDPYTAAAVLRGTRWASYVGRTEVGGTPVRHFRGTADLADAARYAPADVGKSLAAAAKGFATTQVPFDAYLDDQGRLVKLRQRFSFVNGRQKTPVAVTSTTLLYDFGASAVVELPHQRDIYAGRIAEEAGTKGA